jgi:long-chain fatty acid transport protein
LLPVNSATRLGIGAQRQESNDFYWGIAAEYLYGGTMDTNEQSPVPVAVGGRGKLVGAYDNAATLFLAAYFNWII